MNKPTSKPDRIRLLNARLNALTDALEACKKMIVELVSMTQQLQRKFDALHPDYGPKEYKNGTV